jgi:hypothetical protein
MWPERSESDAVMYFRMSAAAADPALSGSRGIGFPPEVRGDKSCIDMGARLQSSNCQLFPENRAKPCYCHVFADYCQLVADRTNEHESGLLHNRQLIVVPISDIMST